MWWCRIKNSPTPAKAGAQRAERAPPAAWAWIPAFAGMGILVLLSACGFTPMYAEGAPTLRAPIEIANIPDRDGQQLRNNLIDRLNPRGRPLDARYILNVDPLKTTMTDLGIQKDATVTRVQIEIAAHVVLKEKATGAPLFDRTLHAVGGYDVLDQQYATLVTRQSVKEHILAELADTIVTALDLGLVPAP